MYRIIFIASLILTSGLCFSEESNSQQKDRELQIFSQVLDKVRAGYVDVPSDNQLQEKSIEGLLSNLDPHSTYLDKDEYQQLQGKTSGNAGGLGIDISLKNQVVQVVTTLDTVSYTHLTLPTKA